MDHLTEPVNEQDLRTEASRQYAHLLEMGAAAGEELLEAARAEGQEILAVAHLEAEELRAAAAAEVAERSQEALAAAHARDEALALVASAHATLGQLLAGFGIAAVPADYPGDVATDPADYES